MHQLTSTRLAGKCRRIALWSLAMLLVTAAGSHADTLISQTAIYDVFVTDLTPVGSGAESLYSTMLYVVNTTGNVGHDPTGFDGVFFGYSGVSGSLHQHDDPTMGIYTPTADSSLFATAIDTHFLNTLAELIVVTAPFETRNVAPSAEPSDSPPPLVGAETTFGDRLSGTFALAGGAAGPTWHIAQLVAGNGTTISLDFAVSGILEPGPAGDVQTSFLVPEPATLSLLAISSLGLLRRKKT